MQSRDDTDLDSDDEDEIPPLVDRHIEDSSDEESDTPPPATMGRGADCASSSSSDSDVPPPLSVRNVADSGDSSEDEDDLPNHTVSNYSPSLKSNSDSTGEHQFHLLCD